MNTVNMANAFVLRPFEMCSVAVILVVVFWFFGVVVMLFFFVNHQMQKIDVRTYYSRVRKSFAVIRVCNAIKTCDERNETCWMEKRGRKKRKTKLNQQVQTIHSVYNVWCVRARKNPHIVHSNARTNKSVSCWSIRKI